MGVVGVLDESGVIAPCRPSTPTPVPIPIPGPLEIDPDLVNPSIPPPEANIGGLGIGPGGGDGTLMPELEVK